MNKKTKGAWLVFQTGKLQRVDSQADFEATFSAGKAGILLSSLSTDRQTDLSMERVRALAKASNINTRLELPEILKLLELNHLADVTPNGISVLGATTAATLQHTSQIFESLNPAPEEEAALWINEATSEQPRFSRTLQEQVSDQFELSKGATTSLFHSIEEVGFVDAISPDSSSRLLFNGNLFRREEAAKTARVLDTLKTDEQAALSEFMDYLETQACLPVEVAEQMLGARLFKSVASIGLFDISVVSNSREEVAYITRPGAFGKYISSLEDDAFDLAKMFVSSLTYGMTRSSYARGEIRMIERLLGALIRGEEVGPVQAIGEDYKVLELRGVVKVYNGSKGGRAGKMMQLLKKEVGVLALDVIQKADASEHSLDVLPSAAVNMFRGPERNRELQWRNSRRLGSKAADDILLALRTGA